MTAARCTVGSYCFKKSNRYILDKCNWLPLEKMITLSSLNFIYNIEKYKKPKGVLKIFRNSKYNRQKQKLSVSYIPKYKSYSKFFIYDKIALFNEIPTDIKEKSKKIFKNELKMWIKIQPVDTND